jgi:enediyne biosynthesis protein E4
MKRLSVLLGLATVVSACGERDPDSARMKASHPRAGSATAPRVTTTRVLRASAMCWAAGRSKGSPGISFSDVTAEKGLLRPLRGMYAHAAAWGDVNRDGWPDLFVGSFADRPAASYRARGATRPAPDRLLLGGRRGFKLDPSFAGQLGRTSGAAFANLSGDRAPELVISRNYRPLTRGNRPTVVIAAGVGKPRRATTLLARAGGRSVGLLEYDHDDRLDPFIADDRWTKGSSVLLRNQGHLRFADVTAAAGLSRIQALGVATADVTNDGWPDLAVSGTGAPGQEPGEEQGARLFVNTRRGGFREIAGSVFTQPTYGADDDVGGVAVSDLNRDGFPEVVLGEHYRSTRESGRRAPVTLYLHLGVDGHGDPRFRDVTKQAGLVPLSTPAPDVHIADFDNDGWPDILATASAENGTRPAVFRNLGSGGQIPRFAVPRGLGRPDYWVGGPHRGLRPRRADRCPGDRHRPRAAHDALTRPGGVEELA